MVARSQSDNGFGGCRQQRRQQKTPSGQSAKKHQSVPVRKSFSFKKTKRHLLKIRKKVIFRATVAQPKKISRAAIIFMPFFIGIYSEEKTEINLVIFKSIIYTHISSAIADGWPSG